MERLAYLLIVVLLFALGLTHQARSRLIEENDTTSWHLVLPEGGPTITFGSCYRLERRDVVALPHGYLFRPAGLFVHEHEAKPSGDDDFWLCEHPKAGREFYSPLVPPENVWP